MDGPWATQYEEDENGETLLDEEGNPIVDQEKLNRYQYNGKELTSDLGLNWNDYGARWYDPATGRFPSIDPKAEQFSFQTPYAYAANDPIKYVDKNGENPVLGAFIGAAIDYASQVTVNLYEGKSWGDALTQVSGKSILISAGAAATGVGIAKQIKNFGTVAKIGTEIAADAAISTTSQALNEGKVTAENIVIDVAFGQVARKTAGVKAKGAAKNSKEGKVLQAEVNRQNNISRGKSRKQGVKKSDANIPASQNKLDNFTAGKAAVGSAAAAGTARKATKAVIANQRSKSTGKEKEF